ncbi:MAG: tol-pal system protein YbgF, partial [Desulfovibrio sp.]
YETAQTMWAEFTSTYDGHDLTPNAYFWQGECFYQLRDYPQAILAYQRVIEDHQDSSKYPGALLKQGVSFLAIGKEQAGKVVLEQLTQQFPNSPEAEKAQEFLRTN